MKKLLIAAITAILIFGLTSIIPAIFVEPQLMTGGSNCSDEVMVGCVDRSVARPIGLPLSYGSYGSPYTKGNPYSFATTDNRLSVISFLNLAIDLIAAVIVSWLIIEGYRRSRPSKK